MNDFSLLFINLLLATFCMLIMKKYMNIFFSIRKTNPLRYILWSLYYFIQFFFKTENNLRPPFILAINVFLVLALCSATYSASWRKRCIFSMLTCTLWMLVEIIVGILLYQFGIHHENIAMLAGTIISEMLMFLLAVLTGNFVYALSSGDIPLRYVAFTLLIPLGSIFIEHNIFVISDQHKEYLYFAIASGIILLLVNYTIFGVYEWILEHARTNEKNHLYEQQLELCIRQVEGYEVYNSEIRQTRHDITHHLSALLGMIQVGDAEHTESYIKSLLGSTANHRLDDVSHCGNIVVDSLVNYKCMLARREGILITVNIFIPSDLPFQAGNITIVLGNLLDNALDACREIEDGERFIDLESSYTKGVLIVTICNPFNGERCRAHNGRFMSTKKDTNKHGMGLISVEKALEPYQGGLHIDDSDGIFQASVVMYGNAGEK